MPRPNPGDDSNPRSGEGGPRHTPAALAADPAFTGTYAQVSKLSSYSRPYTITHQGSSNILPIHTLPAYEYAFSAGFPILDLDVQVLADGALANIHNTTVDNYASVTGAVNTFTTFDFKGLTVNPSSWLAPGYPNYSPTLIADVLARYGSRAVYAIEAKDGTTATVQKIVSLVTSLGLKSQVIVQCTNLSALAPAVSAGMAAMQITNAPDIAAVAAAGVTGVAIQYATTSSVITGAVAAGLTVWTYGVQRRYDHAATSALGVHGVVSEDPLYTSTSVAMTTKDTFARQVWAPGQVIAVNGRGSLVGSGKLQFSVGQNASTLLGFLCPVANAASSYQIDWTWTFDAIGASASAYPFLHIGAPDDRAYPNNISSAGYADGWRFQLQQNGTLAVYKTDRAGNSAVNPVANVGATAPTDGVAVAMRANVTPTQVILSIPAQTKTVTVTDGAFRGGYIHCGQAGLGGAMQTSISGITIT